MEGAGALQKLLILTEADSLLALLCPPLISVPSLASGSWLSLLPHPCLLLRGLRVNYPVKSRPQISSGHFLTSVQPGTPELRVIPAGPGRRDATPANALTEGDPMAQAYACTRQAPGEQGWQDVSPEPCPHLQLQRASSTPHIQPSFPTSAQSLLASYHWVGFVPFSMLLSHCWPTG